MNGHSFDLLITKENHVVKIPFSKKRVIDDNAFWRKFWPSSWILLAPTNKEVLVQQKHQPWTPWMKCFLFCPPPCMQLYPLNFKLPLRIWSSGCSLGLINIYFKFWLLILHFSGLVSLAESEAAFLSRLSRRPLVSALESSGRNLWSVSLNELTFEAAPFSSWQNFYQVTSCQSGKKATWISTLAQGRPVAWQETCSCSAAMLRPTQGRLADALWRRGQL